MQSNGGMSDDEKDFMYFGVACRYILRLRKKYSGSERVGSGIFKQFDITDRYKREIRRGFA